ncbi:prolyl oligopeptidase family serine peptidase [Rhodococcus sp. X156]|uniref:prolyl oligopeptidase family serine peptidase n=1 Tax=Rhodococcus sp. X156 TaxID=2499145 RepID=UPI000FD7DCFB|nr:prolyl oligopeptidase family serine peptidase [Rhodococcus sp. X156]
MTTSVSSYPSAERLPLVDDLHGHLVADPYRWLEERDDPRTVAFQQEQNALSAATLAEAPGRAALAAQLHRLIDVGSVSAPAWRANRQFFLRRQPGQEHSVLLVREPDGSERVLLDPIALDASGKTTLDSWVPSREGTRLAYQLSVGGNEESLLHVLDVDTGALLDGPIDRCRYSPVAWLPGGEELFYVRRLAPAEVPADEAMFHRRVRRHRVGTDPDSDELVTGAGMYDDLTFYFGCRVSADGAWLVVDASPGTAPRDSVWIADLAAGTAPTPVLTQDDAVRCTAWVECPPEGPARLFLLTTDGAPRFRLCAADPHAPTREHWQELVAEEPDSVLEGVRLLRAGSRLVLARSRHAVGELHLHEADGSYLRQLPVPGTGSLTGLSVADAHTAGHDSDIWIGYTDFTTPSQVHRIRVSASASDGTDAATLVEAAPGAVDLPELSVQQVQYRSTDGETIRMFLVSAAPLPDRPRPTLLTGYGGFSLSREPGYAASALTWVQAGGVWALPSLRGGGEEGEDWHRAGMRAHKQNVFNDFHCAAEHLVAEGWTTPAQLAIMGGSNGGLLVGAALTQRPDLYRAVVCSAPLLDMVRYELFSLGRTWNDEYGTAADPEELGWLLGYSPYHHVREGTAYPATLFTVFASDSRVDPVHAEKMCAALQHATAAPFDVAPILLRTELDVGHGARSLSRTVTLATDQLAFLAQHTDLRLDAD